jgi:phage/plasmid-like protein (TIGR03299 family)
MSHELEMVKGQAQMAYRESAGLPWHGLGTPVSDDMTPREMMVAAGLDWRVEKHDNFINLNGEIIKTGQQSLVRETDGRILTNVGKDWNPVQNEEAFEFFNEFVSAGDMVMDTAGSIKDGEMIWAAADIKDGFSLFGGDEVKGYLMFSNPHRYGKSIDVKFIMTRVVCNNTLSIALAEKNQPAVRMSHRSEFDPSKVKQLLGLSQQTVQAFKERAEFLGSKTVNPNDFKAFLGKVFGVTAKDKDVLSRTAQRAMDIVETQPGAEFQRGSWWQAYNAVTFMTDHELGRTDDARAESAWFGYNAKRKLDALDTAIKFAEAA